MADPNLNRVWVYAWRIRYVPMEGIKQYHYVYHNILWDIHRTNVMPAWQCKTIYSARHRYCVQVWYARTCASCRACVAVLLVQCVHSMTHLHSSIGHKCQVCWWMQSKLSMWCEVDSSTQPRNIVLNPQHVTRHLYKCFRGLYRTRKGAHVYND